ncbi:MAG: hypothetical protein ACRD6R_14295 [Candidatus Polarisedimenticolia bacterium]
MNIVMLALVGVGYVAALIGGIWMVVNAFKTSVGWGLGTLFLWLPFGLIYLVKHWQANKKPFFIQLAGLGLIVAGVMMAPTVVQ